jgi:6-phosphofructokinase 2
VDALLDDQTSIMVGIMNKDIVHVPFNKAIKNSKPLNHNLLDITEVLSI